VPFENQPILFERVQFCIDIALARRHTEVEHVQNMSTTKETGEKIFQAALELFRIEGFENATMRDIAQSAGVATGAAYYYYRSKEAIVLEFYRRASEEMRPKIEQAIASGGKFEARLHNLIGVKLDHFTSHRGVLRALLRSGADPSHP